MRRVLVLKHLSCSRFFKLIDIDCTVSQSHRVGHLFGKRWLQKHITRSLELTAVEDESPDDVEDVVECDLDELAGVLL